MSLDEDVVPMVMVRRGTEFQELIRERPTFVEMTECLKTSMVTEKYFDTHFIGWFYGKDWLKLEDAKDDEGRHFLHILCESPVRSDAFRARDNLLKEFLKQAPHCAIYTDNDGNTPLHYVLRSNPRLKTVRLLLDCMPYGHGYLSTTTKRSLLMEACSYNCSSEIIRFIMEQIPFSTIVPHKEVIGWPYHDPPIVVQDLPIADLFMIDKHDDKEYIQIRNEMKEYMSIAFHCFISMIIAEEHRKKDPKIITAFNALREDANWMIKLVEKYPSDLFVFDYTEVSHICVKDSIAEILRDVQVQNIMDE